jgi:hypothetical protein
MKAANRRESHSELAFDRYAILADQWTRGEIGGCRDPKSAKSSSVRTGLD